MNGATYQRPGTPVVEPTPERTELGLSLVSDVPGRRAPNTLNVPGRGVPNILNVPGSAAGNFLNVPGRGAGNFLNVPGLSPSDVASVATICLVGRASWRSAWYRRCALACRRS